MAHAPKPGVLLFALTLAAGCGGRPPATAVPQPAEELPGPAAGTIAVSVLTMNNPFFKVIADSMAAEARKHGYRVIAASGDFDVARQQNQVKEFLVQQVSAIVLCPCDSKAIGPAITEANAAGIPAFTADIACPDPAASVVAHIATDNFQGGQRWRARW